MSRPEPHVEAVVAWCVRCVSATSDPATEDANGNAADSAPPLPDGYGEGSDDARAVLAT